MRCGVDPGKVGFRPRFVGVDEVWKDFWNGDGALSSSGASERPPAHWLADTLPGFYWAVMGSLFPVN